YIKSTFTHSPDKKHFTCSVTGCGRVYSSSSNLKRHLKTHLDSCPYKCNQEGCGQEFKKRQRLLTHLSLTHKLKQF
uniref:C2H2-type domain-containing protein n=1 Tax=Amphimedon queenslandica TaxID=400682 RepID=A0A1X7UJG0_AMPQE